MIEYSPRKYLFELEKIGTSLDDNSRSKALGFVVFNHQNLVKDISKENGKYLESLLSFFQDKKKVKMVIKNHKMKLLETDNLNFLKVFESLTEKDSLYKTI